MRTAVMGCAIPRGMAEAVGRRGVEHGMACNGSSGSICEGTRGTVCDNRHRSDERGEQKCILIDRNRFVRSRPTTDGAILALARPGDRLLLLGQSATNGWLAVEHLGRKGWIAERGVELGIGNGELGIKLRIEN